MSTHDVYFKMRFLDPSGQELVEVSKERDHYTISTPEKLQQEAQDDHVVEGLKLPAGAVFAGPFKLETQGGKVVTPHTTTLHFATPVYSQGKVRGIAVSNVALDKLLIPTFRTRNLIAVDMQQGGMYVTHPDTAKEFGPYLNTGAALQHDFPAVVEQITARQEGIITLGDGSFLTYYTTKPIPGVDRQWKIISVRDLSEALTPVTHFRTTFVLILLLVLVGAALLALFFAQFLSRGVQQIADLTEQISLGNFQARAVISSKDEVGRVATGINRMLDTTLTLIQSQTERDTMQASIVKLLDEVSGVADGDLTVQAEVTTDITGAIADAFNYMIHQLRALITHVQDVAFQVSEAVNEIQMTAARLAEGSASQAAQIVNSSAALDEMAVSIHQVSDSATRSATVAAQALGNARQGATAVHSTIEAMYRMRTQVEDSAARIKRLGEHSQEIGDIVQLIGDIADRTSVLALNAAIEAALAGEVGQGFAVVAQEVERLAERAAGASRQIAGIVTTIQQETAEAIKAMTTNTSEVVQGAQLAEQAGHALGEIEGVSAQLADLIQAISLAAGQQARGSENLSAAMSEIAEVTQQTAAGTQQTAVSIRHLATLADELRSSISTFKVPVSTNGNREDC